MKENKTVEFSYMILFLELKATVVWEVFTLKLVCVKKVLWCQIFAVYSILNIFLPVNGYNMDEQPS